MAFTQANYRIPDAFNDTVPDNRLVAVFGTTWIKPAAGWQKRRNRILVHPDEDQ